MLVSRTITFMVCLDRPRSAGGMPRSLHATDRRGDRPRTFRRRDESWFFPRWEHSRSSASNRRRSALPSSHGDGEVRHRGCSPLPSGSGGPHFALGSLHPDLAPATRESPSASAPYLQRLNAPKGYFIRAERAAEPHRGLLFDNGAVLFRLACHGGVRKGLALACSLEEPQLVPLTWNARTSERLGGDWPRPLVQPELATVDVEDLTDQVGDRSLAAHPDTEARVIEPAVSSGAGTPRWASLFNQSRLP